MYLPNIRTFISKSFVEFFNLFFTLIIFSSSGLSRLIFVMCRYKLRISLSREEHLHRIRSPILKVSKLWGDGQISALSKLRLVLNHLFATFISPWISRLRYTTIQFFKLLTTFIENLPQTRSSRLMKGASLEISSLWRILNYCS